MIILLFLRQINEQHGTGRKRRHSSTSSQDDEESQPSRQQAEEQPTFMTILKEKTEESKSRNTRHIDFNLHFMANKETSIDPRSQLEDAFTKLYAHAFSGRDQTSGILLQFYPPNWVEEFTIPLRPPEQNSPNVVAGSLMKVNKEYGRRLDLFDGASEVRIIVVWPLDPKKGTRCLQQRKFKSICHQR